MLSDNVKARKLCADGEYRSVEMLYAYITEGRKPEERVQDVVMIMVTKENIDTYQKELSA